MPYRVVLADDHALVRAGIRALLEQMPDVIVVGEASDGNAAVALARAHQPDVVLLDIAMPDGGGFEAAATIGRDCPGVKIIFLSMYATPEYVDRALRLGASGYLLKDAAVRELEAALRAIERREVYLSSSVAKAIADAFSNKAKILTPRQLQVLELLVEGRTTKETAVRLGLSPKTVETHRAELMARLDIQNVAGLVKYAIRTGLVRSEP